MKTRALENKIPIEPYQQAAFDADVNHHQETNAETAAAYVLHLTERYEFIRSYYKIKDYNVNDLTLWIGLGLLPDFDTFEYLLQLQAKGELGYARC